jgi:hypothetical protein
MSPSPTQMNVLLTVRTRSVADGVIAALSDLDVQFYAAASLEEVDAVLDRVHLDHVIMGGGLDLESRLQIVRRVFQRSNTTTVQMNPPTGPETYLPFVRTVLHGLLSAAEAPASAGTR